MREQTDANRYTSRETVLYEEKSGVTRVLPALL